MKLNNSLLATLLHIGADVTNEAAEAKRLRDMSGPAALYSLFETSCIAFGWMMVSAFMGLAFSSEFAVVVGAVLGLLHTGARLFFIKQFNAFIISCENEVE